VVVAARAPRAGLEEEHGEAGERDPAVDDGEDDALRVVGPDADGADDPAEHDAEGEPDVDDPERGGGLLDLELHVDDGLRLRLLVLRQRHALLDVASPGGLRRGLALLPPGDELLHVDAAVVVRIERPEHALELLRGHLAPEGVAELPELLEVERTVAVGVGGSELGPHGLLVLELALECICGPAGGRVGVSERPHPAAPRERRQKKELVEDSAAASICLRSLRSRCGSAYLVATLPW
jgi:hypothetical protein